MAGENSSLDLTSLSLGTVLTCCPFLGDGSSSRGTLAVARPLGDSHEPVEHLGTAAAGLARLHHERVQLYHILQPK